MRKVKENNIIKLIITIVIGIILLVLGGTNGQIGKFAEKSTSADVNKESLDGITISYGENVIQKITDTSNLKVYYFDVFSSPGSFIRLVRDREMGIRR